MPELNILFNVLEAFRKVFHRKYAKRTEHKKYDNKITPFYYYIIKNQ